MIWEFERLTLDDETELQIDDAIAGLAGLLADPEIGSFIDPGERGALPAGSERMGIRGAQEVRATKSPPVGGMSAMMFRSRRDLEKPLELTRCHL